MNKEQVDLFSLTAKERCYSDMNEWKISKLSLTSTQQLTTTFEKGKSLKILRLVS